MQNCERGVGCKMSAHSWTDVWKLFLELLSRESIAVQIAAGLGAAFIAVMALEGIRASFFPRRIIEGVALRAATPPAPPSRSAAPVMDDMDIRAGWDPVDAFVFPQAVVTTGPRPGAMVNASYIRRSSPRHLRVIGARKPS